MRASLQSLSLPGDPPLPYTLYRSARKSLQVAVKGGVVQVRVPWSVSGREVEGFLQPHRAALIAEMQRQQGLAPPWCSGAPVLHAGRILRLQLQRGVARLQQEGDELHLFLPQPEDLTQGERLIRQWRSGLAQQSLPARVADCSHRHPTLAAPLRRLRLRTMRSRWGSCSRQGDITLNSELMRFEPELSDYVILHELCHLHVFNHGPQFWSLLHSCMPDYEQHRQRLTARARAALSCW